jgi:penicillin-binding protein 1A
MMTLFRAVTAHGTGAAVAQMNHALGGKTGTTSDFTDAWFMGFSPSVTCGVWVGYDSRQSLGEKETGARAALPIWMEIMKTAIAGKDDEQFPGDTELPPLEQAKSAKPGPPPTAAPHPVSTFSPRPSAPPPAPRITPASAAKSVQTGLSRPVSQH